MSQPSIKVRKDGPAGTIILDRPEQGNAITRRMFQELQQALYDFHQEKSVRAVILTGAGDAFCTGMDVAEMKETAADENALELWREDAVEYRDLVETMMRLPKPIIAAVNGPALAGGAGLVLAADVTVATTTASLGVPDPQRGLVAGLVAPLLAFRAGGSHASRMLLTAEPLAADEAHRIGLFHELVTEDKLWARAVQLAETIAKSAPQAIQLTKQMLYETIAEHLGVQFSSGAAASAAARTTEAATEGIAATLENRQPQWP